MSETPYSLFEVFGVELEYMLVARTDLNIKPEVDKLIALAAGEITGDYTDDGAGWANELVLHVIELRTDDPAPDFASMFGLFQDSVQKLNALARSLGGRLMPGAMHPWMDPAAETRLWPHEYHEVYEKFNSIFNCRRHGWANLQSCQLNLPFADDEEFGRLHAAIRVLLPIMPALASSSPVMEGKATGLMNNRLEVYKSNAAKAPLVAGYCIPEPVYTKRDYEEKLLKKIYEQIRPLDPEGTLAHEWVNARGAIARFDRDAIEVRVLDMQECPAADVAVCAAIAGAAKLLVSDTFRPTEELMQWDIAPLKVILDAHIRDAEKTVITDSEYLRLWGIKEKKISSRELWHYLIHDKACTKDYLDAAGKKHLETILKEGVLSRRILKALGTSFSRKKLADVYTRLCDCLAKGEQFHA